jgi:hypothetical protein
MLLRMRMILAIALLAPVLCTPPAAASDHGAKPAKKSEHGKSDHGKAGEKDAKPKEGLFGSADNVVPLPAIIAPVAVRGNLASHLYMFLAAVTPSANDAKELKEKLPYVLDDLILTVYTPATDVPKADAEPNYAALVERVKASINRTMGREIVTKIEVGKIDTAPY